MDSVGIGLIGIGLMGMAAVAAFFLGFSFGISRRPQVVGRDYEPLEWSRRELRDDFAREALNGICSRPLVVDVSASQRAREAYMYADAMMAVRNFAAETLKS